MKDKRLSQNVHTNLALTSCFLVSKTTGTDLMVFEDAEGGRLLCEERKNYISYWLCGIAECLRKRG